MIRNGFIYQPANVALVGESVVLSDESSTGDAFEDAREPVAQAFKQVGTPDTDAFAVIVNHFKSKGSGTATPSVRATPTTSASYRPTGSSRSPTSSSGSGHHPRLPRR